MPGSRLTNPTQRRSAPTMPWEMAASRAIGPLAESGMRSAGLITRSVCGSAAPADIVELLVLDRPREVAPFVLQPLPQRLRPLPDPRPHPPEVLLCHLTEAAVGLGRGDLLGGVLQDEHRGGEAVLDLVVHSSSSPASKAQGP